MSFAIHGIGTSVPAHEMSQPEALSLVEAVIRPDPEQARLLKAVYRRAGVKNRHTCVPYQTGYDWARLPQVTTGDGRQVSRGASTRVRMQLYEQHAAPLATAAATTAITKSGLPPRAFSHLVTVSCTGFSAPGVDAALIEQLGLSPEIERVQVGFMGCHGAINGLRATSGLTALDRSNHVLMCAVELCSLHYFFDWEPDKLVSNALFADGAAAVVASQEGTAKSGWRLVATGSCMLPESVDAMTWRLGDHGFEMTLCASVPQRIASSLRAWLTKWLARQGLEQDEIKHWAIHPGGPRILSAVAEALELEPNATQASREVLAQYGNMSSPTVLFIIEQLAKTRAEGPCVMIAFGPGLVAEVALLHYSTSD